MPVTSCPNCHSRDLETDQSAGRIVCRKCYAIAEEGLLVSEVGFSEGAGGRVHVQGAFVSHFSTGIAGYRGRTKEDSTANVIKQGNDRIKLVADDMGIEPAVAKKAPRFFTMAVHNKFNRGRRTEYVVASCLYLACRMSESPVMLIDFSERLAINVFELGATYLRLRAVLNIPELVPVIDPAIYSVTFANRLALGTEARKVADDASRLIKRFRADWMTQGRRPAGVCGACLVIAARMSNYLRTPEEVAQVVKVAPMTIRKRLLEFAHTEAAKKTVGEWRQMTNAELDQNVGEEPPSIKQRREADARREAKRQKLELDRRRAEGELPEEDEGTEDDVSPVGSGSTVNGDELDELDYSDEEMPRLRYGRKRKGKERASRSKMGDSLQGAIQAAADEYGEEGGAEDDEDVDLDLMDQAEYMRDVTSARDNPEEVMEEIRRDRQAYRRDQRELNVTNLGTQDALDAAEFDSLAATLRQDEDAATLLEQPTSSLISIGEAKEEGFDDFDQWDDHDAVVRYMGDKFFSEEKRLLELNDMQLRVRVESWLSTRSAQEICVELECIERARLERELGSQARAEVNFSDIDDDELEGYYYLEEDEKRMRARIWLDHNARWLEEDRERQEKKAAIARAKGLDPNKPRAKKKKKAPRSGPYNSVRDAVENFASTKKFSSRLNYGALQSLGLAKDEAVSLESFDDEKEDEKEDDDEAEDDDEELGGREGLFLEGSDVEPDLDDD